MESWAQKGCCCLSPSDSGTLYRLLCPHHSEFAQTHVPLSRRCHTLPFRLFFCSMLPQHQALQQRIFIRGQSIGASVFQHCLSNDTSADTFIGLIFFAVQRTQESFPVPQTKKRSVLQHTVIQSHPYDYTIVFTIWTFVGKVLLLNTLSVGPTSVLYCPL